jgi:hypothetical protein
MGRIRRRQDRPRRSLLGTGAAFCAGSALPLTPTSQMDADRRAASVRSLRLGCVRQGMPPLPAPAGSARGCVSGGAAQWAL